MPREIWTQPSGLSRATGYDHRRRYWPAQRLLVRFPLPLLLARSLFPFFRQRPRVTPEP